MEKSSILFALVLVGCGGAATGYESTPVDNSENVSQIVQITGNECSSVRDITLPQGICFEASLNTVSADSLEYAVTLCNDSTHCALLDCHLTESMSVDAWLAKLQSFAVKCVGNNCQGPCTRLPG